MHPRAPLFIVAEQRITYQEQPVLSIQSLSICSGEKVALIGPSGAGKSTLLKLLYDQHQDQIALCPQSLGLVPALSVFHNIYMGRLDKKSFPYNLLNLLHPLPVERQRVEALCQQLGLSDKLKTSVDRLSGGQMQRTAIARALNRESEIFFGDEPVSSIDEHQARRIIDLILHKHATVVVTLHDQSLALSCFDRIIGLNNGKIVLDQPREQLSKADLLAVYNH